MTLSASSDDRTVSATDRVACVLVAGILGSVACADNK
jgi:hypothetical protein